MWNVIYEDAVFHWYTYPFLYGIAGSLFLVGTLTVAKIRGSRTPAQGASKSALAVSPRRVLDLSMLLLLFLYGFARLGAAFYSRAANPFEALFDFQQRDLTSDVGFFAAALLWLFCSKFWPTVAELSQSWAGPLLLAGAVGAIGCLSFGCCFGHPVADHTWYGIRYKTRFNHQGSIIGAPAVKEQMLLGRIPYSAKECLPVHPVQLYHAVLLTLGGVALTFLAARTKWVYWFPVAALYYMLVRVLCDPFRGDLTYGLAHDSLQPWSRLAMLGIMTIGFAWTLRSQFKALIIKLLVFRC